MFHAQTVINYELMHFYSIDIKPIALRTNAQKNATLSTTFYHSDSLGICRKTSLTTYWRNQESQTLLHMLPEITETAQCYLSKKSLVSTIDWTPTPTVWG